MNIRSIVLVFLMTLLTVGLASCSKEEEKFVWTQSFDEENLYCSGSRWVLQKTEGYYNDYVTPSNNYKWDGNASVNSDFGDLMLFDGYAFNELYNGGLEMRGSGSWSLSGDTLKLVFDERDGQTGMKKNFNLVSLTFTKLVMEYMDKGDNTEYYCKLTYNKK